MNRNRPPSRSRALPLPLFAFIAGGISIVIRLIFFLSKQPAPGNFFGTYWAAGRAAMRGQNPFATYPESALISMTPFGGIGPVHEANLNPPWITPFLQAAAHLSLRSFCIAWSLASFALLLTTVWLLMRRYPTMQTRQVLWLMLCTPVMEVFWGAQIYFPMLLLAALAWITLERDDWLPAIAIGLIAAFRPNFLCWPIFLLLRRDYRLALRSFTVFALTSLSACLIYGMRIYRQWLAALANDPHWASPLNVAIPPTFRRLHLPLTGWTLACALALIAATYIWFCKPNRSLVTGLAIGCSILCSPLAWISYLLPMMPGLVRRPWGYWLSAAAFPLMLADSVIIKMQWHTSLAETALGASLFIVPIGLLTLSFFREDPPLSLSQETRPMQNGRAPVTV